MSKMSTLKLELDELANSHGYESYDEALTAGYTAEWVDGVAHLERSNYGG